MKVLYACPFVPWPLDSGGRIRVFRLLEALAGKAEIHLRAVLEPGREPAPPPELEAVCASVRLFERARPGPWMRVARPKIERWFHSPAMAAAVRGELETGGFDLVHLEELLLARLVPAATRVPVVQHHQKLDTALWESLHRRGDPAGRFDLYKLRRLEREAGRLWRHHVTCSEEDAAVLRARFPNLRATAVPSGYDPAYFAPSDPPPAREPGRLLFLGQMAYGPNADAAVHLVREILPAIRARHAEVELRLVGGDPTDEVRALAGPGVTVTGAVADVRPELERASLLVVPLRIGGGTRLKIVEALGIGCPVVSTTVGAEGLGLVDGEHLAIADGPQALAGAVCDLLDDPERAARLARAGRDHVARRFTWDVLADRLLDAWREAARA